MDDRSTLFAGLLLLSAGHVLAMPGGAQVAAGSAAFAQNGNRLTVTNSPGAILNWQSFSIGAAESVRFVQQNAQSAVLNRVVGQSPSAILGSLQSNGRVFLVNPNGILFGAEARIDVAGLVASSLNVGDADFLAGRHHYTGAAGAGGVTNQGSIATPDGGLVYLIAPDVRNSGVINAPGGDVLLAAGHSLAIAPAASPDVRVRVTAPAGGQAMNVGRLIAQSGSIGLYGANVVQAGVADATAAVVGSNGKIMLKATNSVTAKAGSATVADGGDIVATSGTRTTVERGASLRADRGRIRLWSDNDTFANGSFRARGGFVETSGKYVDTIGIGLDAAGGKWLIDPGDVIIGGSGTDCSAGGTCAVSGATTNILAATINTALSNDISVTVDTAGGTGGNGDISVNSAITKSTGVAATLTLNADRNIGIYAPITANAVSGGVLDVTLNANRTTASAVGGVQLSSTVSTRGGAFTSSSSNFSMNGAGVISTTGGPISITTTNAAGNGIYLPGSLQTGGGYVSLTSNASGASAMQLHGSIDASTLTLNLPNGGTASDNSTSSKIVASALELLGNSATFSLGSAPQWVGGTGHSISAPGAGVFNSAQSGSPTLTVAGNLTGTSTVYLYVGTPNVAFVSGTGMNTDLSVGTATGLSGGGTTGLNATNVSLTTANGNIGQTQKITATNLNLNADSIVDGGKVNLTIAGGNSVTNLQSGSAMCNAYSGCTLGPSATPSFQFTNATALNITGAIDVGNGAAVIKTLTGNIANTGAISTKLAGTASNYANAIILVAGANTPANFVNTSGFYIFNLYGANSRYVIYSKDASSINMGGSPPYSATTSGGYTPYFGAAYYASPFNGSGLPAVPANAAKQHALVFQVQPTLNIAAQAASRQYGNANPTFTYTSSGFVLGDTAGTALSGGLGTAATATSGVGTYPITQGTLTANGYLVNYSGANLTVSQRPVTIAANPQTKTYGSADPALTYTVSAGSVANSDVLSLTRAAGENVGSYAISLGTNPNYSITYTGANLDITAAPIVVVPTVNAISAAVVGNPSKTYDGTTTAILSSGNFALSGFVGGDSATVTKTTGSYDSAAVGTRTVTVSLGAGDFAAGPGTSFSNYSLPSSASGTGTISAAPLTVTANDARKTYDGRAFSGGNGVSYAGFVNGETVAVLGGSPSYGGTAQGAVNAGSYAISASGLNAANYAIRYVDGRLDIGRAALTVTANDAAKTYDGAAYRGGNGVRMTGFVNGEGPSALGGTLAYGGSAQGAVNGGSYAISAAGLTATNYAISYVDGRLVINPATLTVTANDAVKTYDGARYRGGNGVRYAGFVNGEGPSALGGALAYGGSSQGAVEVGSYAISPSGLSSANYAIGYVDGTLTVERMPAQAVNTLVGDSVSATTAAAAGMATPASTSSSGSLASGNSAAGEAESPKSSPKGRGSVAAKEKGSSKDAPPAKPRC
jgi:filamentous hemagglutinin family protein